MRHEAERPKSFLASAVLTLLLAFATSGCVGTARPSGDDGTVLTLLHTNDLHGSILYPGEPRGIAKIATLAGRIRKDMPHVLLLDGGDIIHGTPAEKLLEGQPVIAAMNAARYDAAVAGNHEFDYELFGGYTRQHLVVVRAPGARITEMLDVANDGGVRLHLSGVDARDGVLHVGDAPLDARSTYTVVSAAHIIQKYLLGKAGVVVVSDDPEAPAIRDATIAYLRGHVPLNNF